MSLSQLINGRGEGERSRPPEGWTEESVTIEHQTLLFVTGLLNEGGTDVETPRNPIKFVIHHNKLLRVTFPSFIQRVNVSLTPSIYVTESSMSIIHYLDSKLRSVKRGVPRLYT